MCLFLVFFGESFVQPAGGYLGRHIHTHTHTHAHAHAHTHTQTANSFPYLSDFQTLRLPSLRKSHGSPQGRSHPTVVGANVAPAKKIARVFPAREGGRKRGCVRCVGCGVGALSRLVAMARFNGEPDHRRLELASF